MAANIAEFRTKLGNRVKDPGKLAQADVDAAIVGALEEYQKARPRERVVLVTGTGAFDYLVSSTLTGFVDGFAAGVIKSIAYPWSTATPTPPILNSDQYGFRRLVAGLTLTFVSVTPTAAQQFLVTYTTPHTVDSGSSSVSPSDDEALADLAACYACEALGGFYSQSTDGSISADSVDHRSKADMYRSQAKRWRDAYLAKMQGDAADEAAIVVGNPPADVFSSSPPFLPTRRFFHGRP